MHICHKSKKDNIILKFDFEKAFDKIEHEVIIQFLKQKGFSEKWISWIRGVLNSGSSSYSLHNLMWMAHKHIYIPNKRCIPCSQYLSLKEKKFNNR